MTSLLARLLLVVSVALLPALGFQVYTESEARRIRQHLVEDEALRLVHLVGSEQQRIAEGAEQVLTAIGAAPSVQDNVPEGCQRLLATLLEQSPRYTSAAVIGLDGHVVCAPEPFDPSVTASDRTYFRLALQTGGFAIGEYTVSRRNGEQTIQMAKPFRNRDGMVAGVVAVALDLDWLEKQLERLDLPPGATVAITDRNGTFLARRPGGARFVGQSMPATNRFTLEENEIRVVLMASLDEDRPTIVAYSPPGADPKGLMIGVGLDREVTFAAVAQANRTGLVLIIAGVGWALAMTALVGKHLIRRPLDRLLRVADRWRTGDLAARTNLPEDSSEFGRLAGAFDRMAVAQEARQHALRQSEQHFRATFEQAAVGMVLVGLDETILRVNDKLCAITGYTRDEMLAFTFPDITHPDDQEADHAQKRALLAGEIATREVEKRYLRKDGAVVLVKLTATLLRDPEGMPESFFGVVEDITARKRTEAALRESETRLQLAREAAGFGVWDWDMLTGAVIWSDEEWRLHGREPQPGGADHDTWRASVHPEDYERVVAERAAALADPARPFDTEYRVLCSDGSVRWLLAKAVVVRGTRGEAVRMVGLNMDVTASRQTEATLRRLTGDLEARVHEEVEAREAAQKRALHAERMQALGQLAGGIAHDFNNVLQAVEGAASLIEDRPGNEADVRRFAQLVIEAAGRGASITRRLLAFGRHGDLRTETLDTAALLGGLREILAHTLGIAIEVHVRLEADPPPLLADKAQLETALVNLATNARDAMPNGGTLTISAAAEVISTDGSMSRAGLAPGRYVRLTVADTGMGMDAATLAHAGEPFFSTKALGVGTGLGLPMAKGFAEQSGGALDVESNPGKGTTVTLWLPAADSDRVTPYAVAPQRAADAAASGTSKTTTSTRVLVVDDEDLVREVLAKQLQNAGYDVLVATNGTEALALLAAGQAVDVLVTDLSMPGLNGLAVIRAGQELRPGLPAVLLTGYAGDNAALAVGGSIIGAFSLLRKPIRIHDLVDRIQILLAPRANRTR